MRRIPTALALIALTATTGTAQATAQFAVGGVMPKSLIRIGISPWASTLPSGSRTATTFIRTVFSRPAIANVPTAFNVASSAESTGSAAREATI